MMFNYKPKKSVIRFLFKRHNTYPSYADCQIICQEYGIAFRYQMYEVLAAKYRGVNYYSEKQLDYIPTL